MAATPVVVTRPEEAGRLLTAELCAMGLDALWWPAFDLAAAPDPQHVASAFSRLASFDLAIFVSPAAVRASAAALAAGWPPHTRIAAVGRATEYAVLARLGGTPPADVIGTDTDDASGSEALWTALQAHALRPRRVLVLRAQAGRDWLPQRLRESGAEVETLAVYTRRRHPPRPQDLDWLRARATERGLASVITSSETVAHLVDTLHAQPAVLGALRHGPALASHPRVAARLRAAGFGQVRSCIPQALAVAAALGAVQGGS